MEKGIRQFLKKHAAADPVSFHMPGHKGAAFYEENGYGGFFERLADMDVTEITGADNLFQAESVIAETMEKYRRLYDADRSYLLINGSSGGIIASILATVPAGGKLIMARNCHKSVFNALSLGGITPVYAYPALLAEYGIAGEVTKEDIEPCLDEAPDAAAVILSSPNYYGICSDIEEIAKLVHDRGKVLIVDQAHGAHLKFFERLRAPQPADGARTNHEGQQGSAVRTNHEGQQGSAVQTNHESQQADGAAGSTAGDLHSTDSPDSDLIFPASAETGGADLVINSTHKTLGSFTQTAVLNVCAPTGGVPQVECGAGCESAPQMDCTAKGKDAPRAYCAAKAKDAPRVDIPRLEDKLQALESSSPSYLLMASLDINADILLTKGDELIGRWADNLLRFTKEAEKIEGLRLMKTPLFDASKLNLDMSALGLDGDALACEFEKRGIFAELSTGNIAMCMTGIGNTREHYDRLLAALGEIAEERREAAPEAAEAQRAAFRPAPKAAEQAALSEQVAPLEQAAPAGRLQWAGIPQATEEVSLDEAAGRVCASLIIPYPPGIPIACPGEVLTKEITESVKAQRQAGHKVIGVSLDMSVTVGR